jgi:hypothetical protein
MQAQKRKTIENDNDSDLNYFDFIPLEIFTLILSFITLRNQFFLLRCVCKSFMRCIPIPESNNDISFKIDRKRQYYQFMNEFNYRHDFDYFFPKLCTYFEKDSLHMKKIILNDHKPFLPIMFAIDAGAFNIVKYLFNNLRLKGFISSVIQDKYCNYYLAIAMIKGNIQFFQELIKISYYQTNSEKVTCDFAIQSKNLKFLRFLREEFNPPFEWGTASMQNAVFFQSLDILKYMVEEKHKKKDVPLIFVWNCTPLSLVETSKDILLYLWKKFPNEKEWNQVCYVASKMGNLEKLKFFRQVFDPPLFWDENVCNAAVIFGHINILQYIRNCDTPCPWNENTCELALRHNQMNVLSFLREKLNPPCPWNEKLFEIAVHNNNSQMLHHLKKLNLNINIERCLKMSINFSKFEILRYVCENMNIDQELEKEGFILDAIRNKNLEYFKYIWEKTKLFRNEEECMLAAIRIGHKKIIKYLKTGCNPPVYWNENHIKVAVSSIRFGILKILHSQRAPYFKNDLLELLNNMNDRVKKESRYIKVKKYVLEKM